MISFGFFALAGVFTLLTPQVHAATLPRIQKRQCAATLAKATSLANSLQSHYYVNNAYTTTETWTDANTFEDLNNLMLAAGVDTWANVNTDSHLAQLGAANAGGWDSFFQGSFDDAQWVILSYWKMADYLSAHGQDGSKFMASAAAIYDYVSAQWDTGTCGGGLWWSSAKSYKNAITNELFLLTSANGYLRTKNPAYLDNAKKTWDWLKSSGMRNSGNLWNDGLDISTCKNNGQTTWTYNQGVIASGLANLGVATGDASLFDEAEKTLDAAISGLTENGIMKEPCDNAVAGQGRACNLDQQIFKGIFTKHIQYYLDAVNDSGRTAKYSPFLGAQQSAVEHFSTDGNANAGNVWYAASQGGSLFTAQSSASGLAATVADAKYGPC